MSKTFRRAAMSSICMLIVAVMSLTGATYAWFSAAEQAVIDKIDVDIVDAEGSIEVATELKGADTVWMSTVTVASKEGAYAPVSTVNALDAGKFTFYTAKLQNDKKLIKTYDATGTEYHSFDLYFRNTGASEVKVDLYGTTVSGSTEENIITDGLLATRIGLVKYASVTDTGALTNATYNGAADANGVIYEPYASYHTQNGVNDTTGLTVVPAENATKGVDNKHTYYGLVGATGDNGTAFERKVLTSNYSAEVTTVTDWASNDLVITVAPNSIAKITVYIWIEGQDCDCMNDIASSKLDFAFKFTSTAATNAEIRPEGSVDTNQTRG